MKYLQECFQRLKELAGLIHMSGDAGITFTTYILDPSLNIKSDLSCVRALVM